MERYVSVRKRKVFVVLWVASVKAYLFMMFKFCIVCFFQSRFSVPKLSQMPVALELNATAWWQCPPVLKWHDASPIWIAPSSTVSRYLWTGWGLNCNTIRTTFTQRFFFLLHVFRLVSKCFSLFCVLLYLDVAMLNDIPVCSVFASFAPNKIAWQKPCKALKISFSISCMVNLYV